MTERTAATRRPDWAIKVSKVVHGLQHCIADAGVVVRFPFSPEAQIKREGEVLFEGRVVDKPGIGQFPDAGRRVVNQEGNFSIPNLLAGDRIVLVGS